MRKGWSHKIKNIRNRLLRKPMKTNNKLIRKLISKSQERKSRRRSKSKNQQLKTMKSFKSKKTTMKKMLQYFQATRKKKPILLFKQFNLLLAKRTRNTDSNIWYTSLNFYNRKRADLPLPHLVLHRKQQPPPPPIPT